jgi:hypothetical protein
MSSHIITIAKGLVSEEGENPEYDRGVTEVVSEFLGVSMDEKVSVARLIGVHERSITHWVQRFEPGARVSGKHGVFYPDRVGHGAVVGTRLHPDGPVTGVLLDGHRFPVWVPEDSIVREGA